MKPSPADSQDLYLGSLAAIGLDPMAHDVRFVEDDWESPTLGAWGLGWEVWCDGMEVSQYTYFQQVGGIECDPVPLELTYGLERLAMYVQGVGSIFDLDWNGRPADRGGKLYRDIFHQAEQEYSAYNFECADTTALLRHFEDAEAEWRPVAAPQHPAAASRLRPVHEGKPPVQPARRQGCHQRRRAPGLHRPGARARARLLRSLDRRRRRLEGAAGRPWLNCCSNCSRRKFPPACRRGPPTT